LTSNVVKIRLHFVLFLCENIFDRFLTWFQQEGPLIHLIHHELSELFKLILVKFLKLDFIGEKSGADLLKLDFKLNEKQLTTKHIRIGNIENDLVIFLATNIRCYLQASELVKS
jgi:hypothetical protein